jgi:hypothetical protein
MYWILFFLFVGGGLYLFRTPTASVPAEPRETPYENLYMFPTGDETATVDESEDLKKIGVVEETTPEGIVRMKFADGIFLYWSNRAIQYKYLETVARKYVMVYDCREHYINIFEELALAAAKPKQEPVHPAIFASFKKYNTKRKQIKHKYIVNEKSNQYNWKGKISDYDPPIVHEVKPVRYSDFKKM